MDMMTDQKKTAMNPLGQCGRILSQQFRPPVFFLALLLLFSSAAFAQLATADILGTVSDATGAVVPGANITLTNLGTNETRTGQSNSSGDYSFTLLPVGHYSITVKAAASRHPSQRTSPWKQATAPVPTSTSSSARSQLSSR
jgi:hypothetical protein